MKNFIMKKSMIALMLMMILSIFQVAVAGASSNLSDGDYKVDVTVYKPNSNVVSMMNTYAQPNSGQLRVVDGKQYVSFVLKQSAQITHFKTEQDGVLTDSSVVSTDSANNTRRVEFAVEDLSSKLNAWVKIYWQVTPNFLYDNAYDVQLGFSNVVAQ